MQLVRKSVLWQFVLSLCLLTTLLGCKDDTDPYDNFDYAAQAEYEDKLIKEYLDFQGITEFTRTPSGLYYVLKTPGNGEKPVNGQTATVHYVGKFVQDSKTFDSSYKRAEPIDFVIGAGKVIKGWDEGILLMSKHEKALLIIPSHLAYGRYGNPNSGMPGGATLMFEMDVLSF